MKTIISLVISIAIIATNFMGCNRSASGKVDLTDVDFIVLQGSYTGDSALVMYNHDGDFVREAKINMPDLNSGGTVVPNTNGEWAYIPGMGNHVQTENDKVLVFNMKTGEYQLPKIGFWGSAACGDEHDVYMLDSATTGPIYKYDISKNEMVFKYHELGTFASYISIANDKLLSFNQPLNLNPNPKLNMFAGTNINVLNTDTLEVEKTITAEGVSHTTSVLPVGDTIYFTPNKGFDQKVEAGQTIYPNSKLYYFNFNDQAASFIDTGVDFVRHAVQYKDSILVSHFYNIVDDMDISRVISVVDPSTKQVTNITVEGFVEQMAVRDDLLYAYNSSKMYIYHLPDFTLQRQFDLKQRPKSELSYNRGFLLSQFEE